MGRAWKYLERLTRHPHRGPATVQEREAALEIRQWLADLGYTCELQSFETPSDTLCLGSAAVMGCVAVALVVGRIFPWAGLLAAVVFLVPFAGELLGHNWVDLDMLLPQYRSQNVVARTARAAGRTTGAVRTLVVSAHYDTPRASWLFHPRLVPHLRQCFLLTCGLLVLAPSLLLLVWILPHSALLRALTVTDAALLLCGALFLAIGWVRGGYSLGANDNGTGAALVLALAEGFARAPIKEANLVFVLTGAEAAGTRGMKAFLRQHRFDPATTRFVNLDHLGGGNLRYLTGEGLLGYRPYGPEMLALATDLAREHGNRVLPGRAPLLPTDGLIPALAGYQSVSFLACREDGQTDDRWDLDTLEQVDQNLLEFAESFLVRYLHLLGRARQVELR